MQPKELFQKALNAHQAGQEERAESLCGKLLKKSPRDAQAVYLMGLIRYSRKQYEAAVEAFQKSLALNDHQPGAFHNVGMALAALGRFDESVAAYRRAVELQPQNEDTIINLASQLLAIKQYDEAIELCRRAIALKPESAIAYYNLGIALQSQHKSVDAVQAYQQAIACTPAFPEAYCNLGVVFMSLGRREEAVAAYRKAIAYRPTLSEALNNLGQPLSDLGRQEEASEAFERATMVRPDYAEAFVNLARTYRMRGMMNDAIVACRKGLAIDPNNTESRIELGNLCRHVCDWHDYGTDMKTMAASPALCNPFIMINAPASEAEQLACARAWAKRQPQATPFRHDRTRRSGRIRIGYLSCDFHTHATAYLMAELFEKHDRSQFETFAYAYDCDDGGDMRKRLVASFDHFVDVAQASHTDAAQRIYNDGIDILVDLKGYTGGARTEILVSRPAPIQANFIGYPGTMGADFIDYVIADPVVLPLSSQPFYVEKIVQLPHCYQPNDSQRQISGLSHTRALHGLPEQGFVFCCFNAPHKIVPEFFDCWMRLLAAVPGSVLWLLAKNSDAVSNLRRAAVERGIDPQRLVFASLLVLSDHLARHRMADLFLDTLPYGAHTTASDALWAGLPVVTCVGDTFAGRVGASLLQAVGMPELITHSLAEYEAKALMLAQNPAGLSRLKSQLIANLPTAPLFDTARYAKGLEKAYIRMVELWRAGEAPQAFAVHD